MYAIDEAKQKLAAAGEELQRTTSGHEARIGALRERETSLQSELQQAQERWLLRAAYSTNRCGGL